MGGILFERSDKKEHMRTLTIFIAGIIVGMLIAPDKGENTRNSLKNFVDKFKGEGDTGNGLTGTSITSNDVIRNDF